MDPFVRVILVRTTGMAQLDGGTVGRGAHTAKWDTGYGGGGLATSGGPMLYAGGGRDGGGLVSG